MEEIAARGAGATEMAEDDVVALIAAGLNEDERTIYREGTPPNGVIAWLTYRAPDGSMGYTTVAHGHTADGPWIADGRELAPPASVLVVHDPVRLLRELAAKRAIIGQQTSDHAPVESVYGLVCRTCVDWQDAPWAEGGETEFGIAIPQAWPCGVARAVAASWPGRAEQKP